MPGRVSASGASSAGVSGAGRVIAPLVAFLVLAPILSDAAAVDPPRKVAEAGGIAEYRLDNGFQALLFPLPVESTLSVSITYFAGSRHERDDEAGLAHLMEHIMFHGTPTRPDIRGRLEDLEAWVGSVTMADRTTFAEVLPASLENLAFALSLESDRMVNCRIDTRALAAELGVVRGELEAEKVNPAGVGGAGTWGAADSGGRGADPAGILERRMASAAYERHNYGRSVFGSPDGIERVSLKHIQEFYSRHYRPDNAMIVVAGNFDPAAALLLIQKYFGPLPRPARPIDPPRAWEPVQDGERSVVVRRPGVRGMVGIVYHGVPGAHQDFPAQMAVVRLLAAESYGRLYKELVDEGPAESVSGAALPTADAGLIQFVVGLRIGEPAGSAPRPPESAAPRVPTSPTPADRVRDRMIRIVEEFSQRSIRDADWESFLTQTQKEFDEIMSDGRKVAWDIPAWAAAGDWRLMPAYRDRFKHLTPQEVARFAKNYLKPSNRTVGTFIPTPRPDFSPHPDTVPAVPRIFLIEPSSETVSAIAPIEPIKSQPETLAVVRPVEPINPEPTPETVVDADRISASASGVGRAPSAGVSDADPTPADIGHDETDRRPVRMALKNGMTVAFAPGRPRAGAPAVEFVLTLHAAGESKPEGHVAAALLPHMLAQGSDKHTFQEIQNLLDRLQTTLSFAQGDDPGVVVIRGRVSASASGVGRASSADVSDIGRVSASGSPAPRPQVPASPTPAGADRMPGEKFPAVIPILWELLSRPAFPAQEFERLKSERIALLEEKRRDPRQTALRSLSRRMKPWPKDDARYVPTFEEEIQGMRAVTLDDVSNLYRLYQTDPAARMTFAGEVEPGRMKTLLEKHFRYRPTGRVSASGAPSAGVSDAGRVSASGAPSAGVSGSAPPGASPPFLAVGPSVEKVVTPGSQTTVVAIGRPLELRQDDSDFAALSLLAHVLGSSPQSRLAVRIRRETAIGGHSAFARILADPADVGDIGTWGAGGADPADVGDIGTWGAADSGGRGADPISRTAQFNAGMVCSPKTAGFAMRALIQEMADILQNGVRPRELDNARKSLLAELDADTARDEFSLDAVHRELHAGRVSAPDRHEALRSHIQSLTPADIRAAGARHLKMDQLIKVWAGDFRK